MVRHSLLASPTMIRPAARPSPTAVSATVNVVMPGGRVGEMGGGAGDGAGGGGGGDTDAVQN